MSSSSNLGCGSSRSSTQTSTDSALMCFCGYPSPSKISWTKKNPSCRFRNCAGVQGFQCGYFVWIDLEICPRAKEVIPALREKIFELGSRIIDLQVDGDFWKREFGCLEEEHFKTTAELQASPRRNEEREARTSAPRTRSKFRMIVIAISIAVAAYVWHVLFVMGN